MTEKEYVAILPIAIIAGFILIMTVGIPLLSKVCLFILKIIFKICGVKTSPDQK